MFSVCDVFQDFEHQHCHTKSKEASKQKPVKLVIRTQAKSVQQQQRPMYFIEQRVNNCQIRIMKPLVVS